MLRSVPLGTESNPKGLSSGTLFLNLRDQIKPPLHPSSPTSLGETECLSLFSRSGFFHEINHPMMLPIYPEAGGPL